MDLISNIEISCQQRTDRSSQQLGQAIQACSLRLHLISQLQNQVTALCRQAQLGSARDNHTPLKREEPSFNDKLRDELLNLEIFDSMWEVRTMLQDRRHSYNHYRTHSSLSYLTPVEFSNKWHEETALLLSQEVDR